MRKLQIGGDSGVRNAFIGIESDTIWSCRGEETTY